MANSFYYTSYEQDKKKKFNIISLILLGSFLLLFSLMVSGFSYWGIGRIAFFIMVLLPLAGAFFAFKGTGWARWLLFLINGSAFIMMVYILLTALGITGG
ncbi:hypothetical protein [Halobacillus campisalis]|uniref:Uncharacterized protein n=1 Tax=Halobacillus campisalis TaxID=435909 RepID=A0ABW2K997_9BACI|nr:hypothetical protein [Halobacillus campisalis]